MTEEFNLSGKIWNVDEIKGFSSSMDEVEFYKVEDVKEAVRRLKAWLDEQHIHYRGVKSEDCAWDCWGKTFPKEIDELFGEKLT